jgi:hypothetical protein
MQAFFEAFFEFFPMRARYRKFFARVQPGWEACNFLPEKSCSCPARAAEEAAPSSEN